MNVFKICLSLSLLVVSTSIFAQKNMLQKISVYNSGDSIKYNTNKIYLGIEAINSKGKRKYVNKKNMTGNLFFSRLDVKIEGNATCNHGVITIDRKNIRKENSDIKIVVSPKNNPSVKDSITFHIPQITQIITKPLSRKYLGGDAIDLSEQLFFEIDNKDTITFSQLDEFSKDLFLFDGKSIPYSSVKMPKTETFEWSYATIPISHKYNPDLTANMQVSYNFGLTYNFRSTGQTGERGHDGRGVTCCNSCNSRDGKDGVNGYDGRRGGNGPNVDVYISESFTLDSVRLIKVEVREVYPSKTYYLDPYNGFLVIDIAGGVGGTGGCGADGTNGANSTEYSDVGRGGNGGNGGNGGMGGDGGNAIIHVSESLKTYANHVIVNNPGGAGGAGGRGGRKGMAGRGDTTTKGQGWSSALGLKNGSNGYNGEMGTQGRDGAVKLVINNIN